MPRTMMRWSCKSPRLRPRAALLVRDSRKDMQELRGESYSFVPGSINRGAPYELWSGRADQCVLYRQVECRPISHPVSVLRERAQADRSRAHVGAWWSYHAGA